MPLRYPPVASGERVAIAKMDREGRIVVDPEYSSHLRERGDYGREVGRGALELTPEEALYLVERGRLRVLDESGRELSREELIEEFVERDREFWTRYILYYDLRKRGFIVKEGFSSELIEYRIKKQSEEDVPKYVVFGVKEGRKISFSELERIVKYSLRSKKTPVIAVIDKEGNISYYQVSKLS